MRAKYASKIRRAIEGRLAYDRAYEMGFSYPFLEALLPGKKASELYRTAFLRTALRNGKVFTGEKLGQPFKNPMMRDYEKEENMTEIKNGDRVRSVVDQWADLGEGDVIGISNGRAHVRFDKYEDYDDEEFLDYHEFAFDKLKKVRTLAEKRHDDFKVLEEASRPWREAPDYYRFPHGVQTTDVTMHLNSNGGQAVGYISRSTRIDGQNKEDDPRESLRKAIDLIQMEIYRLDEKFGGAE